MERMKKYIVLALAALAMLQGCVIYNDRDETGDASQEVAMMLYTNTVHPVFRIAELADFYEAYQKIQEDREASLALAEEYFGDNLVSLYYEDVTVEYWGMIKKAEEDHVYYADSFRMWNTLSTVYRVIVTGPHVYYIECESVGEEGDSWKKFMTSASVTVGDSSMRVEELVIEYVDKDDVSAVVRSTDEIVQIRRSSRRGVRLPYSGTLRFEISGSVSDSFAAQFSDNGMAVLK